MLKRYKVLAKSTYLKIIFKTVSPHITMPPKPIVTRWGRCLLAASYCCEFLDEFILVLNELDVEDATSINICKDLIENAEIKIILDL